MHKWKFYLSSPEAWDAMLKAIESAKETIILEQYILYPDSIGLRFLELLKKKSIEGIKIKILCDEVGSFALYRSEWPEKLIKAGIEFRFFNSIALWSPQNESLWYFRDHQKLLMIDGVIGFTGGACFGEEMRGWRESHIKIEGPILDDMKEVFNVMWEKKYRNPKYLIQRTKKNFLLKATKEFSYVNNLPIPGKRFMYYELIRAIKTAKKYIYITTPYFLPDMRLMKALKGAVRKGVDVKLLVPYYSNHFLADIGAKTFFTETLLSKIKIFRYRTMIHSKTLVIDGVWSTIGSLNLDNLSLRYNFEANIVSTNQIFAHELEQQFKNDLSYAKELSLKEWDARGFKEKFLETLIFPFRKLI